MTRRIQPGWWLALLPAVLIVGSGVYISVRSHSRAGVSVRPPAPGLDAELSRVRFFEFEGDRLSWRLQADRVEYRKDHETVEIFSPRAEIHLPDGRAVTVAGGQGLYQGGARQLEINREVVAEGDGYRLETDRLIYAQDTGLLQSEGAVTVRGQGLELTGDKLEANLTERRFEITDRVHLQLKGMAWGG